MGIVYYAEYLHFFERSRNEYIRQLGMSYAEIEARGIYLPVREVSCRYRSPARYDDLLLIHAGISEMGRASLRFVYEIWDTGKTHLIAEGTTQHALTNPQGKPVPAPEWFVRLISGSAGAA